jgi:hypothetical protein
MIVSVLLELRGKIPVFSKAFKMFFSVKESSQAALKINQKFLFIILHQLRLPYIRLSKCFEYAVDSGWNNPTSRG